MEKFSKLMRSIRPWLPFAIYVFSLASLIVALAFDYFVFAEKINYSVNAYFGMLTHTHHISMERTFYDYSEFSYVCLWVDDCQKVFFGTKCDES